MSVGRANRFSAGSRPSASNLSRIADRANELSSIRGDDVIRVNYVAGAGVALSADTTAMRRRLGSAPFLCVVAKDAGNAGGAAQECSYTYTVKDASGATTLGTGVTPQKPRQHYVEYWYAGETRTAPSAATSTYGLAAYASDGTLLLLEAYGEIMKDDAC